MTTASDKNPHHLRILNAAEIHDLYSMPQFTEDDMALLFELNVREATILSTGLSIERKINAIIQLAFFVRRNGFLSSLILRLQQKHVTLPRFILV